MCAAAQLVMPPDVCSINEINPHFLFFRNWIKPIQNSFSLRRCGINPALHDSFENVSTGIAYFVSLNFLFCFTELLILYHWIAYFVSLNCSFCITELLILCHWIAYFVSLNCLFCFTELLILYHWIAYFVSLNCLFCITELLILYHWIAYFVSLNCLFRITELLILYHWIVYFVSLNCLFCITELLILYHWIAYFVSLNCLLFLYHWIAYFVSLNCLCCITEFLILYHWIAYFVSLNCLFLINRTKHALRKLLLLCSIYKSCKLPAYPPGVWSWGFEYVWCRVAQKCSSGLQVFSDHFRRSFAKGSVTANSTKARLNIPYALPFIISKSWGGLGFFLWVGTGRVEFSHSTHSCSNRFVCTFLPYMPSISLDPLYIRRISTISLMVRNGYDLWLSSRVD